MKNNNIRLIIVNTSISWGGLEINTVKLAKWLSQEIDITLLCLKGSPIDQNVVKQHIEIEYINKPGKYFPLKSSWKLHRLLKNKKCKNIFFTDNRDMSYCCWAKIFTSGSKLYYQQHMQLGINKKDLIHTLRYRRLDAWISPLQWLAEEVKQRTKINPSKVHFIPLGIETDFLLSQSVDKFDAREFWKLDSRYPVIGIIGRLDKLKNQHLLIEATKILKDRNILVTLLIVGEPTREIAHLNYSEELHQMVKDFDMENQVHFHPFTNKIANFYCALDAFVMATNKETYGMVTIEAMLFGAPIIASNSGGSPEIIGNGEYGTLYEPGNAQDMAEKIKYVIDNPEKVKQQSEKAKEIILKDFDYKSECEKIIKLITNNQ